MSEIIDDGWSSDPNSGANAMDEKEWDKPQQTDREELEGEKYWFPPIEKIIQIRFVKTHPDAKLPTKAYPTDSCWDLYACEDTTIYGEGVVPVGIKVAYITPGFGLAIKPRSGLGFKYSIQPHLGEIDNFYRGDLAIRIFLLNGNTPDNKLKYKFKKGDRIAQFKVEKVYPAIVGWLDEVIPTDRGDKGFGSSGK
jgi:dUTP pyrophosphatase